MLTNEVSQDAVNDIEFQTRKRKKSEAKDYLPSRIHNKNLIARCNYYFDRSVPNAELKSAQVILNEDDHFSKNRIMVATTEFRDKDPRKKRKQLTTPLLKLKALIGHLSFPEIFNLDGHRRNWCLCIVVSAFLVTCKFLPSKISMLLLLLISLRRTNIHP